MLSICIPTYNRQESLELLLESILINKNYKKTNFEICISDNCSSYDIARVIKKYKDQLNIKFHKFHKNYGRVANMLKVVSMASKKYVWLIGDDEIFFKDSLSSIEKILKKYNYVEFFYLNFSFLDKKLSKKDLNSIESKNYKKNFNLKNNLILPFNNLFDVKINPDIFGGMFQSIFKKDLWNNFFKISNITDGIKSKKEFSTLTNTYPHSYIFSIAFSNVLSMIISNPVILVSSNYREWANLYPYVRSFRLIEILEINYKKKIIPIMSYIKIKNYLLRYYIVDIIYIFLNKKDIFTKLKFNKEIIKLLYPFPYAYFIYYVLKRIFKSLKPR